VVLADALSNSSSRAITIVGKERGMPLSHIGQVDARVGAHKAMFSFSDDEISSSPKYPRGFAFNHRFMRKRIVSVNLDYRSFCFRNNFLGHNQDIAIDKPKVVGRADIPDKDPKISAFGNFRNSGDWMNRQVHVVSSP